MVIQLPSILQVEGAKDVAVEFFTMSKSYNMAGWRIGFMVGNSKLVSALEKIKSYHDYGAFTPFKLHQLLLLRVTKVAFLLSEIPIKKEEML